MSVLHQHSLAESQEAEAQLERYRAQLTGHCYRMLRSRFEAEDAVQETLLRAWRSFDRCERPEALRSWLYRIATNVCLDLLSARSRLPVPIDLGPAGSPADVNSRTPGSIGPITASPLEPDPAELMMARETVRHAFAEALQRLPARQRAVLILRDVLRWNASEVAELLQTSIASVNSTLQRAHANLESSAVKATDRTPAVTDPQRRRLLARYIEAFESDDVERLTSLIRDDAQSRGRRALAPCPEPH